MSRVVEPKNEVVRSYAPGTPERLSLEATLKIIAGECPDIPLVINGRDVHPKQRKNVVMPHDHEHVLATFGYAEPEQIEAAIDGAIQAQKDWAAWPLVERLAVFRKAADLLAGPWRDSINAATMLGQSKNAFQAEIDAACELADFFRFNAYYCEQMERDQPISPEGVWNRVEQRPLEGFIAAITPFNFTAIAANLPAAPAMLGNVVVWKPSDTQLLSAFWTMRLLQEAGLPPGVIQFMPADGPQFGRQILARRELAGIHFTGSTGTFQALWKGVGENIARYATFPRLVGETGGKDFIFVHPSADISGVVANTIRGAFEYQGQKCSAASRLYLPRSLANRVIESMVAEIKTIQMGDVRDFRNFVNAVIDERAFLRLHEAQEFVKNSSEARVLAGGGSNRSKGYFVEPTLVETTNPLFRTMTEELFGPLLTAYIYDDSQINETLDLIDTSTSYALTGAIFAQDRSAQLYAMERLKFSAGNLYINDKPTGAVVGNQPFGGGRSSGTNDKAGSMWNLARWVSPRTIKETMVVPTDYRYPFLRES